MQWNEAAVNEEVFLNVGFHLPSENFAKDVMIDRFLDLPEEIRPDRWEFREDTPGYTRVGMIYSAPREVFNGMTIEEGRVKIFRALGVK